jgi:uncharacterized membrane protein
MRNNSHSSSSDSVSRFGVIAGASALVLYGLTRRNKKGVALATAGAGSLLAYRKARSQPQNSSDSAGSIFRLNASAADAYQLWRDFKRLPRFMAHLESVRVLDERRSQWTANGPGDAKISWNAEITDDQPGRRIAWRSLPGSDISTSGSVEFQDEPLGRGSLIRARVQYANPLGAAGRALVTAMGKNPNFVLKEDLRRFKALLETGESPTTVGQTHGPRGVHGHLEQVLFRETTNHPLPQAS